ncbi:MAG: patatin-like phospholipase family protein [Gammaproteobacteria bacterium]|nr:patatin-like phospholipase family protein [Gammaproteobacteria bacterium]
MFREGGTGKSFYAVCSGALGVFKSDSRGGEHLVTVLRSGETVGEMALITSTPRSASIISLRDSTLIEIPESAYRDIVFSEPTTILRLTRALSERLARPQTRGARRERPRTVAVIPLTRGLDVVGIVQRIRKSLTRRRLATVALDNSHSEQPLDWLDKVEHSVDISFYVCSDPMSEPGWYRRALRQADRILMLADARLQPPHFSLQLMPETVARIDLVLQHPPKLERPLPTAAWRDWLSGVPLTMNIRADSSVDIDRLARTVSSSAPGLILAGGGARGFAHLGVIKALREAGIPLDLVGGTSMGAIIGAGIACDWETEEHIERVREAFVVTNPLRDMTIPVLALYRGRRVSAGLERFFRDWRIEDLWRPFFCVSTNLSIHAEHVHQSGSLWRALRASIAVPGILPPVVENGQVLVDGGVLNNFPVDLMAQAPRGPLIGVDFAPHYSVSDPSIDLESDWITRILSIRRNRIPTLVGLLSASGTAASSARARQAYSQLAIVFRPDLDDVAWLDWRRFDQTVEAGYRHAANLLENYDVDELLSTPP